MMERHRIMKEAERLLASYIRGKPVTEKNNCSPWEVKIIYHAGVVGDRAAFAHLLESVAPQLGALARETGPTRLLIQQLSAAVCPAHHAILKLS